MEDMGGIAGLWEPAIEPLPVGCPLDLPLYPEQESNGKSHKWVIGTFLERVHTTRAPCVVTAPSHHRPETV